MVNVQKPVDLIFCKLNPSPYKPGWERMFNETRKHQKHVLPAMLGPNYQGFSHKGKVPFWFIQVVHKRNWWRSTTKAERMRRKEYGKRRYFRYTARTLHKVKRQTQEIYLEWKRQARMSNHHPDRDDVLGRLSPTHPGRVRRIVRNPKDGTLRVVWLPKQKSKPKPKPVEKKAKQLPLMPYLRYFESNVRHYRKADLAARKRLMDPNGMLLRNVVGLEAPG
jgi:hypothetical protein